MPVVGVAWLTVCVKSAEMPVLKLPSPLYVAVMLVWLSVASEEVVKVALALASAPVPSVVAPSLNVTVPVRVPAPGETALTVAVKVTDWPNTEGLAEEATVVVELAWLTVWVAGVEALGGKLASAL